MATLGIFAIVLGVFAFFSTWLLGIVGLLLAVNTINKAKKANNKQFENMGYVGIVINIAPMLLKLARVYS